MRLQILLLSALPTAHSFVGGAPRRGEARPLIRPTSFRTTPSSNIDGLQAHNDFDMHEDGVASDRNSSPLWKALASVALVATVIVGTAGSVAQADELGVEVEAPTLFTGENVMVRTCQRSGSVGRVRISQIMPPATYRYARSGDRLVRAWRPKSELQRMTMIRPNSTFETLQLVSRSNGKKQ